MCKSRTGFTTNASYFVELGRLLIMSIAAIAAAAITSKATHIIVLASSPVLAFVPFFVVAVFFFVVGVFFFVVVLVVFLD